MPGIVAGKAAGMKVCAVEDFYSISQKEEKAAAADYYIADFIQMPDDCKRKLIL